MTPWHNVYRRFANLLDKFYTTHQENSSTEFYKMCLATPGFLKINGWAKRFMESQKERSFDPIHIFASFNDGKLSDSTRVQRLHLLFRILGSIEKETAIDFLGCPTPLMIRITARRPQERQREIWAFFHRVVNEGEDALNTGEFPDLNKWYGISISSFTIFLFWIDPEHFLSLDGNTINMLLVRKIIDHAPKDLFGYLELLHRPDLKDYLKLSIEALEFRQPQRLVTTRRRQPDLFKPVEQVPPEGNKPPAGEPENATTVKDQEIPLSGCRLIGLRVYEPTPDKWVKVLKRGKYYGLYNAFSFNENIVNYHESNDSQILYEPFRDARLHDLEKFDVNISAIVGENGSGKSTLTELIFLTINNLTKKDDTIGQALNYVEGICLDFFVMTDSLYKISIYLEEVNVYQYRQSGNRFHDPEDVSMIGFDLEKLFYTIAINYSLYALNPEQIGNWIVPLFEKNDQYQAPIVINPYRKDGNINVNSENGLVKTRLLSTLLLPIDEFDVADLPENIRKLTGNRYAEKLMLKLDQQKLGILYKRETKTSTKIYTFEDADTYWQPLLKVLCATFDIQSPYPESPPKTPANFREAAFMYLLKKVISICITYPAYDFFDPVKNQFTDLDELMSVLRIDTTHVTYKFYQTVHFLRESPLQRIRESNDIKEVFTFNISDLAFKIDDTRSDLEDKRFKTVHFVPPAFLSAEIILTDDIELTSLSSGEKQRIYSVSSLAYHLINLDSNFDPSLLNRYPYVNVMFDEIELYFHPEMQRSFVKYLLDYLSGLEIETKFSINILFITHSPFILSDISSDNILFLGEAVPANIKTFGANIHDLLQDSFFLKKSFMGDFAREHINDLINFMIDEGPILNWDEDTAAQTITLIGEPLIRERLIEIYHEKYQSGYKTETRLKALENEIEMVRNEKNKK
jgi:energy-coupling factor transporter ATP-binding protein EcfA2